MKPKFVLCGLVGLTLATVLVASVLGRVGRSSKLVAHAKTFQVHGQVRSIDAANKSVRITHEEIRGYMPPMTMPFSVKDRSLLTDLSPGTAVQFELIVTENDSWISHIETISASSSADILRGQPGAASESASEMERIQVGERVTDFGLINQDGKPVRLSDYRGQAVVLTFIYTRCPLPNFCPLMSKKFAELEHRLAKEFPNKYHLLSVSIDPEFDRPPVLKEYAERFGANQNDWTFATGDDEQIRFTAGLMGLNYANENGVISHDLRTALIGPDGRLIHLWKSNVWTPYEVQRMVRETLTGDKDIVVR